MSVEFTLNAQDRSAGAFTIGQLAKHTGVGVETIRFYERLGLLDQPPKPVKGYRQYGARAVTLLSFVQAAKRLGFTLRDLIELKDFLDDRQALSTAMRRLAEQKLCEVASRRTVLDSQEKHLEEFLLSCNTVPHGAEKMDAICRETSAEAL